MEKEVLSAVTQRTASTKPGQNLKTSGISVHVKPVTFSLRKTCLFPIILPVCDLYDFH